MTKPRIIMNDFGGTLGGPITLPRLHVEQELFLCQL